MNRIVSAINSGFSDKALSILKDLDEYLSIKEARKLLEILIKSDEAEILMWLIHNSVHRLDFGSINLIFENGCKNASVNIVTAFLKLEDFDPTMHNNSALVIAIKYLHKDIIKLMLNDKRINRMINPYDIFRSISRLESSGITNLLLSIEQATDISHYLNIVSGSAYKKVIASIISDKRIDIDNLNKTFYEACSYGFINIVKILLNDSRVNPSVSDNRAFRAASYSGETEIVKMLLSDSRVDPSTLDNEAFLSASRRGHTEIVKILLADKRVDPSVQDSIAIRLASSGGCGKIIDLLLADSRLDPSANQSSAIILACDMAQRSTEVIEKLLSYKRIVPGLMRNTIIRVDPSTQNNDAIFKATLNEQPEIVKILLSDDRVNPSANNNKAIKCAFQIGSIEIFNLLLFDQRVYSSVSKEELLELNVNTSRFSPDLIDLIENSNLKSRYSISRLFNKLIVNPLRYYFGKYI